MDYAKIITRAWDIIKKRRYLWWLGILAVAFASLGSLTDFLRQVLGSSIPREKMARGFILMFGSQLSDVWPLIVIVTGIILLLAILIAYLSNSAHAGLILSVNQLEENQQEETFGSAFHKGTQYAWRLFGLNLLIGLIIFGLLLVVFLPIALALIFQAGTATYVITGIFAFLGLLALIVLSIYLSLSAMLGARTLVLNDVSILVALQRGKKLVRHQLKHTLLAWLINIALYIGFAIVVGIASAVLTAIFVGLGYLASQAGIGVLIGYSIIAVLIFLAILFVLGGIYTSYFSSYWTIAYRAIDYLEKKSRV
ncbi:MAG: hypothetical protein Q7S37_03220 [bacterium]|nr:hypothetical protein [bacterium]